MSAIPVLKKKLKSVRATGKLSKAMKTVSSVKFSQLSAAWKNYSAYAAEFRFICGHAETEMCDTVVVFGSNRGFCGGLNNDIIAYFHENVRLYAHLIVCGEELAALFRDDSTEFEKEFLFGDVPSFAETEPLLDYLASLADGRHDYVVKLVYPEYVNTLTQTPSSELIVLNPSGAAASDDGYIFIPGGDVSAKVLYEKGVRSVVYGTILKTAIGAQAATLMTMRSAFDTAEEYSEAIEGEIRRLRQSEVTADVIETSSERGGNGGEA